MSPWAVLDGAFNDSRTKSIDGDATLDRNWSNDNSGPEGYPR